jgi:hypothetical protein
MLRAEVAVLQNPTDLTLGILNLDLPLCFRARKIRAAIVGSLSRLSTKPHFPVTLTLIMQDIESVPHLIGVSGMSRSALVEIGVDTTSPFSAVTRSPLDSVLRTRFPFGWSETIVFPSTTHSPYLQHSIGQPPISTKTCGGTLTFVSPLAARRVLLKSSKTAIRMICTESIPSTLRVVRLDPLGAPRGIARNVVELQVEMSARTFVSLFLAIAVRKALEETGSRSLWRQTRIVIPPSVTSFAARMGAVRMS